MSSDDDRRSSKSENALLIEQLRIVERQRKDLEASMRRVSYQLEQLKWQWRLHAAPVAEGQLLDTRLREAGGGDFTTKASSMSMLFASIVGFERTATAHYLTARVGIADPTVAKRLRKGLRKIGRPALGQMHSAEQGAAGEILSAEVDDAGLVTIRARVANELAAQKCRAGVYPGISIHHVDGAVQEIALVDRPTDDLANRDGRRQVFVKLYNGGGEVNQRKLEKALRKQQGIPNSVEKEVAELLARKITPDSGDAQKRAQSFQDFKSLYNAGRQQIFGDPRFTR